MLRHGLSRCWHSDQVCTLLVGAWDGGSGKGFGQGKPISRLLFIDQFCCGSSTCGASAVHVHATSLADGPPSPLVAGTLSTGCSNMTLVKSLTAHEHCNCMAADGGIPHMAQSCQAGMQQKPSRCRGSRDRQVPLMPWSEPLLKHSSLEGLCPMFVGHNRGTNGVFTSATDQIWARYQIQTSKDQHG